MLKKLQAFMEYRETLLEDDVTMFLLKTKEHQAINVVFLFLQMAYIKTKKKANPIIYMLECLLKNWGLMGT